MNQSIAETLRIIAASKPGAVGLTIGPAAVGYGEIILQGLDMYSRLIINVSSHPDIQALEQQFHTDIRVAVHAQDSVTFLNDVSRHRFELVVIDCAVLDETLLNTVIEMSPVGGFIVLLDVSDTTGELRRQLSEYCFHSLVNEHCLIATRIASNHRPSRKGGRRTRRPTNVSS